MDNHHYHYFFLAGKNQIFELFEAVCLASDPQVVLLDVITPCDIYAWNYRELATLFTLNESLPEGGFEPMTIGHMAKNLTTEQF